MNVYNQQQIISALDLTQAAERVAEGFIAFSQGKVKVPPVQNFVFPEANGDCCVKSAWVEGEATFTVKISTGFYDNPAKGLESNDGLMLVMSAQNGQPLALLQDGGWLTCIRTALAGQIAARALAPSRVQAIGIVGSGMQARMQLEQLRVVTACRNVIVWGRRQSELDSYRQFAEALGFTVETTLDAQQVALKANLIVSTTPSREALLRSEWIRPGTHITAVGADTLGKQELDPALVGRADVIVVDSISQCSQYGEISHALKAGLIDPSQLLELGQVLAGDVIGRSNDEQITVVDLTGVAVQDAQISRCALESCAAA
ncbi:ornithine cyclodeaminase family protein [Pseudomonas sp. Bc-h]|uniref:ornithine cyclodeaminase family protein n=1 Tax=Pseudomonas sp. Bc-h TaxID=1943632 RepID=UPI0009D9F89E|nr:ornithine cyclodeaminase family protein [Pseudomonas sp. Bc-h]OQR27712.1 ornithine cyclodeaminase family protein [Pseudomonas sp. Bc-h]